MFYYFSEVEIESKVLLNDEIIDNKHHGMDSDDEQNMVSHLSPQTLLETPGDEVHYSLRSPDGIRNNIFDCHLNKIYKFTGIVTYRVLQVEDSGDSGPQIVTAGSGYPMGNPQPVVTSNFNGQLYVIGNNDMFTTQTGTRAIAPRSSIVETNNSGLINIKKVYFFLTLLDLLNCGLIRSRISAHLELNCSI